MEYEIRKAVQDDLKQIMVIENLCFAHPWSEADVLYEMNLNPVSNLWVITVDGLVVGFSSYWNTFDSGTIAQIAIHPNYQRMHLADALMKDILDDCYAKKVQNLTLEVRLSNKKAQCLYHKHGFKEIVIKPHYYTDGEDAIYMVKEVKI